MFQHMSVGRQGDNVNEEQHIKILEKKAKQLRAVLKTMSYISLVTSVSMLMYGSYSMHYLHICQFIHTLMEVFGLIYCGTLLFMVGMTGVWVAVTEQPGVIKFFQVTLPHFGDNFIEIFLSRVTFTPKTVDGAPCLRWSHDICRCDGFSSSATNKPFTGRSKGFGDDQHARQVIFF
jgi:hypothetical protein